MNLSELIEAAAYQAGNQLDLAKEMGKHPSRLSEWKKGKHRPEPGEILRLAEIAKLPAIQTLVEIESQLDEKHSKLWKDALGKLTAAGVAASAFLIFGMFGTPEKANAGNDLASNKCASLNAHCRKDNARHCTQA
jgi:transcriptional regulator with XRE-family HTH domain